MKFRKKRLILFLSISLSILLSIGVFAAVNRRGGGSNDGPIDTRPLVNVKASATNGYVIGAGEYRVGDEVKLEFKANDNYKFGGWVDPDTADRVVVSQLNPYVFIAKADVSVEAIGIIQTEYAIHVHIPVYINGVKKDFVTSFGSAAEGDTNWLALLRVEQPHYTFDNYYLDSLYTIELDATNLAQRLSELTEPKILDVYGNFLPIMIDVTYDWQDGENIETVSYLEGTDVVFETPVRVHADPDHIWRFDGWYEEAACTTLITGIENIETGMTVYAKWTDVTITVHTITWYVNGTAVETDTLVSFGSLASYDGAAPTKLQDASYTYAFAGWALSEGGAVVSGEEDWNLVEGDLDFYAIFTPTARFYTVNIYGDEAGTGEVIHTYSVTYANIPVAADINDILDGESIELPTKKHTVDDKFELATWDIVSDTDDGVVTITPDFDPIALAEYTITAHVYVDGVATGVTQQYALRELHLGELPDFALTGYFLEGVYENIGLSDKLTASEWRLISADIDLYINFVEEAPIPTMAEIINALETELTQAGIEDAVLPDVSPVGLVSLTVIPSASPVRKAYKYDKVVTIIRATYIDGDSAADAYIEYELGDEYDGNGIRKDTASHKVEVYYDETDPEVYPEYFDIKIYEAEEILPESVAVTVQSGGAAEVNIGDTLQLSANVGPVGASQTVTWSSSDTDKATVNTSGEVTGVAAGDVTITATAVNNVKGTISITVKAASSLVTEFDFTKSSIASNSTAYTNATIGNFFTTNNLNNIIVSGSNEVTSYTNIDTVYPGNSTGGPATGNGMLKVGKAAGVGSITFNFNAGSNVKKVVAYVDPWAVGNKLTINGKTITTTSAKETLTFELDTASDTIAISVDKAILVYSLAFYS